MIKETLLEAGKYDDVVNILTHIAINTSDDLQPIDAFVGDDGKAVTHVSGIEVIHQALELLQLIKDGLKFEYFESPEMAEKFETLQHFVESNTDMMLHNYAVNISHKAKPNIEMDQIRSWLILDNLLLNFGIEDEEHEWYIPEGWKSDN